MTKLFQGDLRVMRSLSKAIFIASLTLLGSTGADLASADPNSLMDAESLDVIQSVAPEVFKDLAATDSGSTVIRSTNQVIAKSSDDLTAEISLNPQEGIVMNDEAMPGENIGISIGSTQQAETGVEVQPGIVSFKAVGKTSVVTVLKEQGSVQVATVIRSPTDPTRYDYDLSLPSGAQIVKQDGAIFVLNSRGEFIGGLARPWARDSEGQEIPTHYEVNGSTITQVVAHNTGDWVYPIVADPYLGKSLLLSWSRVPLTCSSQGCLYKHSFQISDWGIAVYASGTAGAKVLQSLGWAEAQGKYDTVGRYKTTKNQWDCHALGYWTGKTGTWDLEETRRPTANRWTWSWHSCNW